MSDYYSDQYNNLKHLLRLSSNERILIVKLTKSLENKGYASIYFEITPLGLVTINESEFSKRPELPEIFITTGYQILEKQYGGKLFIIKTSISEEDIENRHCKYVSYASNHIKTHTQLKGEMGYISEIASQRVNRKLDLSPNSFNYRIVDHETINYDTPFLFQITETEDAILGPLYRVHGEENIFSGCSVEVRLPFWRRNRSDYQAFLVDITGYKNSHIAILNRENNIRHFVINLEGLLLSDNGKPRNQAFQNIDMAPHKVLLNQFYDSADKLENIKPQPKKQSKKLDKRSQNCFQ